MTIAITTKLASLNITELRIGDIIPKQQSNIKGKTRKGIKVSPVPYSS